MKNKIFEGPNGKYWSEQDSEALIEANSYAELLTIALRVLDRMPQPIVQICGPISTGGKGSVEENISEFEKAILFFSQQGEIVFDQMPFQKAMQRIKKNLKNLTGYDQQLLDDFYLPIFESGKIKKLRFLPDYKSSTGATWEDEQGQRLNIKIIYLEENWYKNNN